MLIFLLPVVFALNITANLSYIQNYSYPVNPYLYVNASLLANQTNAPYIYNYTYVYVNATLNQTQANSYQITTYSYLNASFINSQTNYPLIQQYTYVNANDTGIYQVYYILRITQIFSPKSYYFEENNNTILFNISAINEKIIDKAYVEATFGKAILNKEYNGTYVWISNNLYYTYFGIYSGNVIFPEYNGTVKICVNNTDSLYACIPLNITVNLPPKVRILSPENNTFFNTSLVNITCWANDTVPGLKEIRLNITNLLTGESFVYTKNANEVDKIILPEEGYLIKIYNPNSYDLKDYQLRINLTKLGINYTFFKILDESGNSLPFCFEQPNGECNTTPSNVIWVKVNLTANSNTTIYLIPDNKNNAVNKNLVFIQYSTFDSPNDLQEWSFSGNKGWQICSSTPYGIKQGSASACNQDISDSQSACMMIFINCDIKCNVSFYWAVSSERGYDFLRFYVDNREIWKISGAISWQYKEYILNPGRHTIKFCYTKDRSVTRGSDTGYVDLLIIKKHADQEPQIVSVQQFSNYTLYIPNQYTFNLNLSEGKYSYFCEAEDLSGKVNKTKMLYLTVDFSAPKIKIYSPKNNTTYNTSKIWLNYTVEDLSPVACWYVLNGTINEVRYLSLPLELKTWKYRRLIEIYNPNNYDLKDFQIKIVFNSSLIYRKSKSDGSDIRFTYLNLTGMKEYEIPFCFENSNGECSNTINVDGVSNITVWIKVPYIPANRKAIVYMYYGNPNAKAVNYTGEDVFDFYDDFTLQDGWVYGESTGANDYKFFNGMLYFYVYEACGSDQGCGGWSSCSWVTKQISLSTGNYIIEFRHKPYDNDDNWNPPTGTAQQVYLNNNLVCNIRTQSVTSWRIDSCNVNLNYNANSIKIRSYVADCDATDEFWWDWIRIRKYAGLEPTYTILKEEPVYGQCSNATLELPDGEYNLTLYARDIFGNLAHKTVHFKVNTTIYINVISPKNNTVYNYPRILVNASIIGPAKEAWFEISNRTIGIEVYNPNPYNLTDYQVKIDLTNISNYLKKVDNFTLIDQNGNELPYCFEQPNGECSSVLPDKHGAENSILIVRYKGKSGHPSDHQGLINDYDYSTIYFASLTDMINHGGYGDYYDLFYSCWFYVEKEGEWWFAIDGDDAVEVEIDGNVVASWYEGHGFCNCYDHNGRIYLSKGWHKLIVRQEEDSGEDGVKLYFKAPGMSEWKLFSIDNLKGYAKCYAFVPDDNILKTKEFIENGLGYYNKTTVWVKIPYIPKGHLNQTGKSMYFDGVDDYILTPNLVNYFNGITESVTICLWFYYNRDNGILVDELGQTTLNTGWHDSQIEIVNGEVRVRVWDLNYVSLGYAIPNSWNFVCLVYDSNTGNLGGFLNGKYVIQYRGNRQSPWESGHGLYYALAAYDSTNLGDGSYFNGKLDEVRIYNRALSQQEILQCYLGNCPKDGLVLYYSFENISGNKVIDDSGNGNDGTIHNGAIQSNEGVKGVIPGKVKVYIVPSDKNEAVNGDQVFDFYDDFNSNTLDTNKWQLGNGVYGPIYYSLENGKLKIWSDNSWRTIETKEAIIKPEDKVIVEARVKSESVDKWHILYLTDKDSNGNYNRFGILDDIYSENNIGIQVRVGGGSYQYPKALGIMYNNQWYILRIIKNAQTHFRAEFLNDNWNLIGYYENSNLNYDNRSWVIRQWKYYNTYDYWDWIRVRKYADVEPIVYVGNVTSSTKYNFTNISGNYYWSYVTLQEGNYTLRVCAKNLDNKIFCSNSVYFGIVPPKIIYNITSGRLNVSVGTVNISWYVININLSKTWAEIYYPNKTLYLNTTTNVSFVPNEIGNWTVIFYALDNLGRLVNKTAKFEVVDEVPPNVTMILPKENKTYYNEVPINYTVWDNYKINMCWIEIYKKEGYAVTIFNPSSYNLVDYQLKINISSVSFANFSIFNPSTNKYLNYCFEQPNGECNTTPSDVVWVKVDYLPANSNITLYMLPEEKNNATSGDQVFDFYDDFNDGVLDMNKWDIYYCRSGASHSISNGVLTLTHGGYNGIEAKSKQTFDLSQPIVLELRMLTTKTDAYNHMFFVGFSGDLGDGDPKEMCRYSTNFAVLGLSQDDYGRHQWMSARDRNDATCTNGPSYSPNTWFTVKIVRKTNRVEFYYNGVLHSTITSNLPDSNLPISLVSSSCYWSSGTQSIKVDWIRVRKYADQEPTVYFSGKGLKLINKTILPTCSNITIQLNESGTYLVRVYANDTLGNIGYDEKSFIFKLREVKIYELKILNETLQEEYNLTPDRKCYIYLNISGFPANATIYFYNGKNNYSLNFTINNNTIYYPFILGLWEAGLWNLTATVCRYDVCTNKTIQFNVMKYINVTYVTREINVTLAPSGNITEFIRLAFKVNTNASLYFNLNETIKGISVYLNGTKVNNTPILIRNYTLGKYNETFNLTIETSNILPGNYTIPFRFLFILR